MISQIHAVLLPFSAPSSRNATDGFWVWSQPRSVMRSSLIMQAVWRTSSAGTMLDHDHHHHHNQKNEEEQQAAQKHIETQGPCYLGNSWLLQHRSTEQDDYAGWSALLFSSRYSDDTKNPVFARYVWLGAGFLFMVSLLLASSKVWPNPGYFKGGLGSLVKLERCINAIPTFLLKTKREPKKITPEPAIVEEKVTSSSKSGANDSNEEGDLNEEVPCTIQQSQLKVTRPACEDPAQNQAMSHLHTLKIVEAPYECSDLCSRREYARWLVLASNILARKPSKRVVPAVPVEGFTNLAFDDVGIEDPDFPYIQGLAEAGVIPSNLGSRNHNDKVKALASVMFLPDRYVSREDVVSWKAALEYPFYWKSTSKVVEPKIGYIDMESSVLAKPELLVDLLSGEKSITASAFGLSRRLQPNYVVTKGQAVLAIISGRMSEALYEEISRVESENMIAERRLRELTAEAHERGEQDEEFKKALASLKEATYEAQKLGELELHKAGLEKDLFFSETLLYHKERANVESEKKIILGLKESLIETGQKMSTDISNMEVEKIAVEKQKNQEGKKKHDLQELRLRIETEMGAIASVRMWTEDEARRASAYRNVLLECQKHWGIGNT